MFVTEYQRGGKKANRNGINDKKRAKTVSDIKR